MAAASPGPSVTPAVFPPDPSSQDPDPALTTPSRHRPFTPLIEAPHVATRGPQPGRNMAPVTAPQPSTPGLAPGRTIPEAHAIPGPMLLPPGPSDLLRQPRGPGPTSGVNAMLVTSPEADIGTSGLADSRAVTRTSAPGATPLAGEHREPSLAVGGLSVGGQRGINSASKLRKRTAHLNVNPQGHQRGRSIIRGSTRQIASDRGRGTRRVNPSRAMRPLQFIQMGDNANAVQQAAPDVINPHRADSGLVQAAAQPHDIVSNNSLHVNQGNVQSMHVNQNIEHHLPSHHLPSPIGVNAALNGVNVQAAPQGYNTPLVGIHNANGQSLSQLQHPIMLGIQGVQPLDQGIHSPIAATQGAHAHSLNHAQSISQACHNPIVDQQGVNAQTSANGQSVSQGFHTPLHIAHPPLATDNPDTSIGQSARQILSLLQGAIGSQSAAKTRTNTATVMSGADAEVPSSITAGAAATTSTAQQGSSGLALQNQPAGQPVSSMGQGPPAISHARPSWIALLPLVRSSLAPSTWHAYARMWSEWDDFCASRGADAAQGSRDNLHDWLVSLHASGARQGAIQSKLAALSFFYRALAIPDPTNSFFIRQVIKGWGRSQQRKIDTREPITRDRLERLLLALDVVCRSDFEALLFKTAFNLAFAAALRVSEVVAPSKQASGAGIQLQHVRAAPDSLLLFLPRSKTDQEGKGTWIPVHPQVNSACCPVNCVNLYLAQRPPGPGQFLVHADGRSLSKFQFGRVLKLAAVQAGLDASRLAPHSFRIGAATNAAQAGSSCEDIKRIGRWRSNCFRTYVRPIV
ncbi:uncharacterized protein LOC128640871 isoform X1 [Bombina bombina]|uniref:uncharacterized protein LOC128640871 isoform X1 n=1 Tax=Bombina bombina TaxID=8345 RepID=UPI00235AD6EA|nr:uncharacterized protein LOC128640871 isoform X1 [Bombina bombina]